jgi:hypothetical protein
MDCRSLPPPAPLDLIDEVPLGDDEKAYVAAARAANTLKGYRSDWASEILPRQGVTGRRVAPCRIRTV